MKKEDFIKAVQTKGGFASAKEAKNAVDTVFDCLGDLLIKKDTLSIIGFGTFGTKNTKEKTGTVPGTDKTYFKPAGIAPVLKFSNNLKDKIK